METRRLLCRYAAAALLVGLVGCPWPAVAELEEHSQGPVTYVSGGVGTDERHAIDALAARYNLKVTMALRNGDFVSEGKVHVEDAKGQSVLDATADGPIFLARLQPGTYTVTCEMNGKTHKQSAQIAAARQTRLMFQWGGD